VCQLGLAKNEDDVHICPLQMPHHPTHPIAIYAFVRLLLLPSCLPALGMVRFSCVTLLLAVPLSLSACALAWLRVRCDDSLSL
jgi:hypothetical protein